MRINSTVEVLAYPPFLFQVSGARVLKETGAKGQRDLVTVSFLRRVNLVKKWWLML
jgi:hypothetical protein